MFHKLTTHWLSSGADGAEVIYALRNNNTLANLILNSLEAAGQNVRKAYQRRLPSDTSKDYYFIHRNTGKTQPVIVEYGFLDSTADDVDQLKNDYEKLAQAVVNAVAEYTGIKTGNNYYTVQKGDSLWSIAKKFNTTVNELKNINNLTSNTLSIGQTLVLPTKTATPTPSGTNTYIVKSGDSLYKIANQYNTTVNELKQLNNLSSNLLSIGQVLKIPTKTTTEPTDNYTTYTVVKGDNLYAIARKFNTTQNDIMKLNNLSSNLLSIGQVLKIPTISSKTYTVQKGDSLYSIAKKFNTTVNEIKTKNNLTSNTLSIGQILKI